MKVRGEPASRELDKLREGIVLGGRKTAPAVIERLQVSSRDSGSRKNTWWSVELSEGRTRQIREMFLRIGHPVQRLKRLSIGPVEDRAMRPGDYRELTRHETETLKGVEAKPHPGGGRRKRARGR